MSRGVEIVASVVLYQTSIALLERLLSSFDDDDRRILLYVIDNSPEACPEIVGACRRRACVHYVHNPSNGGYGSGHNIALRKVMENDSAEFVLVLNPDVEFDSRLPSRLARVLRKAPELGGAIPTVINRDGTSQRVVDEWPTPWRLVRNRVFGRNGSERRVEHGVVNDQSSLYDYIDVMSGCFMFLKVEAIRRAGIFDERYFMYMEDVDLCRRISRCGFTLGRIRGETILHDWSRESKSNVRMLLVHCWSAVQYFGKWGVRLRPNDIPRNDLKEG